MLHYCVNSFQPDLKRDIMAEQNITPGSDEERLMLGRWIKKAEGLIVASSALGESYIDPNVQRDDKVQ